MLVVIRVSRWFTQSQTIPFLAHPYFHFTSTPLSLTSSLLPSQPPISLLSNLFSPFSRSNPFPWKFSRIHLKGGCELSNRSKFVTRYPTAPPEIFDMQLFEQVMLVDMRASGVGRAAAFESLSVISLYNCCYAVNYAATLSVMSHGTHLCNSLASDL